MNSFGTPNRHMMFFQMNFWTAATVIVPSGSASIQWEKYSMATTANLYPFRATGNGPRVSNPHLANGQIGPRLRYCLASAVPLAAFALLYVLNTYFKYGWPVYSLAKHLRCDGPCRLVSATHPLMYFLHHFLAFGKRDVAKHGL